MPSTTVAVVGATGRLGRPLVDVLTARGHRVVRISRATGVDVITGAGLDEALTGVEVVVDAATSPSPDQETATAFFTTAARNLHAAGERTGVRLIISVSIIGVDRYTAGYGAAKLAHEAALLAGPLPVHVLRAAQFHELVGLHLQWGTQGDVAYVPPMRTQLVAAATVAEAVADLVDAGAGPGRSEIAGPREESMVEAARLLAVRRGHPLKVEAMSDPVDPDHGLQEGGALLPGPGTRLAGPTFAEWLDAS